MAYAYHDYVTYTDPTAKLARLRLHIQEVSALITAETSAHSYSLNLSTLGDYLRHLKQEEKELAAAIGDGSGNTGYAAFVNG